MWPGGFGCPSAPLPLTTTCLNRQEVCSHRFRPQHRPISRHPQLRLRPLRHRNYPLLRAFRAQKTRSESEQPIARYACIFGVLTQAPIFSVLPTFCFAEAAILRPFVRQRHAWKALLLPYNALSPRQGIAFRKNARIAAYMRHIGVGLALGKPPTCSPPCHSLFSLI